MDSSVNFSLEEMKSELENLVYGFHYKKTDEGKDYGSGMSIASGWVEITDAIFSDLNWRSLAVRQTTSATYWKRVQITCHIEQKEPFGQINPSADVIISFDGFVDKEAFQYLINQGWKIQNKGTLEYRLSQEDVFDRKAKAAELIINAINYITDVEWITFKDNHSLED